MDTFTRPIHITEAQAYYAKDNYHDIIEDEDTDDTCDPFPEDSEYIVVPKCYGGGVIVVANGIYDKLMRLYRMAFITEREMFDRLKTIALGSNSPEVCMEDFIEEIGENTHAF